MVTPAALHSSASVEWYTPPHIVEAARSTMGGIDLDPASCAIAQRIVRAERAWIGMDGVHCADIPGLALPDSTTTPIENKRGGLDWGWSIGGANMPGRVFLNPPGGLLPGTRQSSTSAWWEKLVNEYRAGNVEQAIFIAFSLEALQQTQRFAVGSRALDFPVCIPSKRIRFWRWEDTIAGALGGAGVFVEDASPSHANAIVYLHPLGQTEHVARQRFARCFQPIGAIVAPYA